MTKAKTKNTVKEDLKTVIEYLTTEQAQKVLEFILDLRKSEIERQGNA